VHRTCGSMNCTFAGRLNFDDKLLQPCRFIMRITWKKAEIGSTFVPTTIATKRLVSTHAIAEYHNESAIAQMSHSLTRPTLGGLECRVKHRSYLELNKFSQVTPATRTGHNLCSEVGGAQILWSLVLQNLPNNFYPELYILELRICQLHNRLSTSHST
jgi:hypothetical protein